MCAVSMVSQHYMDKWPMYEKQHMQQNYPQPSDYLNYQELMRKAKLYDEMTKQADCPAPEKVEWQVRLDKYMQDKYGLSPKSA